MLQVLAQLSSLRNLCLGGLSSGIHRKVPAQHARAVLLNLHSGRQASGGPARNPEARSSGPKLPQDLPRQMPQQPLTAPQRSRQISESPRPARRMMAPATMQTGPLQMVLQQQPLTNAGLAPVLPREIAASALGSLASGQRLLIPPLP